MGIVHLKQSEYADLIGINQSSLSKSFSRKKEGIETKYKFTDDGKIIISTEEYQKYFLQKIKNSVETKNENNIDFEKFEKTEKILKEFFEKNDFPKLFSVLENQNLVLEAISKNQSQNINFDFEKKIDQKIKELANTSFSTNVEAMSFSRELQRILKKEQKFRAVLLILIFFLIVIAVFK